MLSAPEPLGPSRGWEGLAERLERAERQQRVNRRLAAETTDRIRSEGLHDADLDDPVVIACSTPEQIIAERERRANAGVDDV